MLFGLLLIAVIVAMLITRYLCVRTSSARIYSNLLWTMALSISISGVWFLHRFTQLERVTVWHLMNLGFLSVAVVLPMLFIGLYWILMRVRRPASPDSYSVTRSARRTSVLMLSVMLGLFATGFYASRIEPNRIEVTRTELLSSDFAPGSPPLKIVQLSDLHIDDFGYRERRALRIIERLNPDLILLTGDYTNHWDRAPDVQRFMKGLDAKHGVYAVHGNWNPGPRAVKFFEDTNIVILEDESRVINPDSGRVVLAGIHWYKVKQAGAPLDGVNTDDSYVILLSHMPDAALHAPPTIDLILAGHTHGGQVRLPFIGPIITFSAVGRDRSAGLSQLPHGGWLYVNRGLGMEGGGAPRIRFLCRPEIAVITIAPEHKIKE